MTSMGPAAAMACAFALFAAIGWGFEGCVAGFAGSALPSLPIAVSTGKITAASSTPAVSCLIAIPIR